MFWLTYNTPKGICVVLQPGSDLMQARFTADVLKLAPGEFKEATSSTRRRLSVFRRIWWQVAVLVHKRKRSLGQVSEHLPLSFLI